MKILPRLVSSDSRAIDIGAHHGLYTYALAQCSSQIEAFEPDPYTAQTIEWWASPRVTVHRTALSDSSGTAVLRVPVVGGRAEGALATLEAVHGEYTSFDVPIRRLDDYNFGNVSFMKIDVEGHERRVIHGAIETIQRERPVILVEIEQRHLGIVSIAEVFRLFEVLGYAGGFFSGGRFSPLSEFSVERHQPPSAQEVVQHTGRQPDGYVNNFLFRPAN